MTGYDFDDVLLTPQVSEVNSRDDVSTKFYSPILDLEVPIISAPMANIVNAHFAITLGQLGGIAILHRFEDDTKRLHTIDLVSSQKVPFGVAISSHDYDIYIARYALDHGAKIICVDVANGYTQGLREHLLNTVRPIINSYSAYLMSGNIATYEGYNNLRISGVDMIRVGIGSGALCTTRNKTGVGIPQVIAINTCHNHGERSGYLVADGGIRNSGDAVKAFALGADFVMLGTAFASTFESAHNGHIFGMASKELQEQFYGRVKSIEGLSKEAEKTVSLEYFINDFKYSIQSAGTYLNSRSVNDFRNHAYFNESGTGSIKKL